MDNTTLVDPLVERDPESVKRAFYHGYKNDWDASKFVEQLRFMAYDHLLGTEKGNQLVLQYPDSYEKRMLEVEKSLAKTYIRLAIVDEAPRKEEWILRHPPDLSHYLSTTHISRWHTSAPAWLNMANQTESNVPLRFNMQLFEAFLGSKSWLEDEREQRKRKWAMDEIMRVGGTIHYSEMNLACRRFRAYDRKKAWSHQGDALEKDLVWSAVPELVDSCVFYKHTVAEGGIHKNNYKDILNYGANLSDAYDRFGSKILGLALACQEFETTGMSSYWFKRDQSGSGPAFQAFWEKMHSQLVEGNFLGTRRGDIYGGVGSWLRSMDKHLRQFTAKELREASKAMARGGNYEGGAPIAAFHILGLDPDKLERLDAGDRLFLEDHVEFPQVFWHHPKFTPLFSGYKQTGEPKLQAGIVFQDIYSVVHTWCRKTGMNALHEGIKTIRPHAKRLREANKKHLEECGTMLQWSAGLGGTVYKIPYKRDSVHTHSLQVSYNSFKGKAVVKNSEYKLEQNISADFDHTCDALTRGITVLFADQEAIEVLTNHDSFAVKAAHVNKVNRIHRSAVVHALRMMTLPPGTKEPKGKSYSDIVNEIKSTVNDTLFA